MQDPVDTIPPEAGLPPNDAAERLHRDRQARLDRQTRVGILRNPKSPPRPPARRAALMGRWPNLRSSRRPKTTMVEEAAQAVVHRLDLGEAAGSPLPVRRDAAGKVQSIDVAGLMASVDGIGSAAPVRAPFAASVRSDGPEADSAARPAPKPAILTPAAWIDDQDDPVEDQDALGQAFRDQNFRDSTDQPVSEGAAARRRGLWIVGLGVLIALGVLVLLPATGVLYAT